MPKESFISRRAFLRGFSLLPICAFTALFGSRKAKAVPREIGIVGETVSRGPLVGVHDWHPVPEYTTFDNEDLTIHMVVGLPGLAIIENVIVS